MTAAIARDPIYRCRRFQPEIIELCVRWYLTYPLSYLDLVEMLAVRGGVRYLYRAVDKFGKTVDSLLCADRSVSAARTFFFKALKTHYPRRPQKLNLDGQCGESSGIAPGSARESGLAIPRGPKLSVSKQHRRAGPSRHQAPLRTDARPQVISYRGRHTGGRG